MFRILLLIVACLLGFYVAWPGWTGYQIHTAINARDGTTLAQKIDFARVRASLKPAARQHIRALLEQQSGAGAGALAGAQLKPDMVETLAEKVLAALVTPANLIRIAHDGRRLEDSVDHLIKTQLGTLGGMPSLQDLGVGGTGSDLTDRLGGLAERYGVNTDGLAGGLFGTQAKPQGTPPAKPAKPAGQKQAPGYGLGHIKRLAFIGPLGFEVGVAKDPSGDDADVTAEMSFVDMDWKLTALRPRLP